MGVDTQLVPVMSADELKKYAKQLQTATTDEDILTILGILKKDFQVNDALLRESKAGLTVGKLRNHKSKAVADGAKELVKKWKTEVEKAKQQQSATPSSSSKNARSTSSTPGTPSTPTVPGKSLSKAEVRTAKGDGVDCALLGDKTRDKCVELMYDALAVDSGSPNDLILQRARALEQEVLNLNDGNSGAADYKNKIRILMVNLKDKSNPSLRESVVSGSLSAKKLAALDSKDMASEERRAADQKIQEENLHNSLGAEDQQAETDAFQCGRCKQRKCRYRQAQTRSADEPMTTFVTCTNCNNRWKFS